MRWNEEILEITVRRTFHRQVGAAQRPRRASISWWCSMGPCPLLRCFKSLGWPWMIPWVIHWENDFLMGENDWKWQEFFKKSWKTHRFLEICSHPSKWQDFFKSLGWLQWMNLKFGSLDGEESIENEETSGLISPIYVILWTNIITQYHKTSGEESDILRYKTSNIICACVWKWDISSTLLPLNYRDIADILILNILLNLKFGLLYFQKKP